MLSQRSNDTVPRLMHGEAGDPELDRATPDTSKTEPLYPENDNAEYTDILRTKELTIEQCSQKLSHVLGKLLRENPEDSMKEKYEELLEKLTSAVPLPLKAFTQCYPQNYLSEILITNYADLVKFCSLYLNLSLSSHVTKFVVNVFYSLECWEIYHLLQMVPNLDYFLRLVDIEVTDTPFGHIVSPPDNFMGFNLRQGFQYPFPFPFYNFSYHTMNPDVTSQKFQRLRIDNYIDIRLNKAQPKKKKKSRASKKTEALPSLSQDTSQRNIDLPRQDSSVSEPSHELSFQIMTLRDIELDVDAVEGDFDDDEDDGYNTDDAERLLQDENKSVLEEIPQDAQQVLFVPSIFQQILLNPQDPAYQAYLSLLPGSKSSEVLEGKHEPIKHRNLVPPQQKARRDLLTRHLRKAHNVVGEPNKIAIEKAKDTAEVVGKRKTPSTGVPPEQDKRSQPANIPTISHQRSSPQEDVMPVPQESSKLPQPPSFISAAPMPASMQYPPQYKEASRLPYYGHAAPVGSHPLPQFPAYASALQPPTLVSPQLNKRGDEGRQDQSPQLQQYGYAGYPAFQPYGQPFYGADGRLFMQMPLPGYVHPMGVPPQKMQGQPMQGPQNIHSPQFQHQQQFLPVGSMPMPPMGYQYAVNEAGQPHGSPQMHPGQSNPTPPPPIGHIRLPHIREDDKSRNM